MAGYTPLFDSLTRGTLCGRWPDIGLWPIILSLSDKDGIVDVTPLYIAGITGLPERDVVDCMNRFCEPDTYSRSQDADGRRLVLLDSHRDWGWQIVNHSKYREKARLMAKSTKDVATGKEAARKRRARETSAEISHCPPVSAGVRPSNANTTANSTLPSVESTRKRATRATRIPDNFELTDERRLVAEAETLPAERVFAKFVNYWTALSGAKARKHDWDATWRNWCMNEADRSNNRGGGSNATDPYFENLRRAVNADNP